MKEPVIKKFNDTDRPIVSLALTSVTLSPAELTLLADPGITKQLRAITGVAEVTVSGGVDRELTVEVRPTAMQAAHVSVPTWSTRSTRRIWRRRWGSVTGDARRAADPAQGAAPDAARTSCSSSWPSGTASSMRLGEVADIQDATAEARTTRALFGHDAVGLDIKKTKRFQHDAGGDEIKAHVAAIQQTLPKVRSCRS